MTLINLLPPSERQPKWDIKRIFLAISIVLFIICLAIFFYGQYAIWQMESQLADVRNHYELLRPTIEKMQIAQQREQQLAAKNGLLLRLTQERRPWYTITARLGLLTPSQVWLTEVAMVDKQSMRIKGMAASYPALAEFMAKIEKDDILTSPTLVKAEQDQAQALTNFEILVKLKGL